MQATDDSWSCTRIRKVKCGEEKPACERCTKTGRVCDGYPSLEAKNPGQARLKWVGELVTAAPRPRVSESEARALDFFRHVVAPVLSGPLRSDFWNGTVMQFSTQAPAVRHAAMAVSSLYEGLEPFRATDTKNPFAIEQYNQSISRLRATPDDEPVVLVVCVLMTCVEMMQGNIQAAIQHCRHGIAILNGSTANTEMRARLIPLFCRLSIIPFLHGVQPNAFPLLDDTEFFDLTRLAPGAEPPRTVEAVQNSLDIFLPRCIRFVRAAEAFRALPPDQIPPDLLDQQRGLVGHLERWKAMADSFRRARVLSPADDLTFHIVEMRYLVGRIWIDMGLEPDEAAYDAHLPRFQRIVDLATLVLAGSAGSADDEAGRPKFVFEQAFMPLLYFVVVKCRCLCTRVAALHAMRALGVMRENLWDVDVMYAVAQNVIELESGVRVDGVRVEQREEPSRHQERVSLIRRHLEYIVEAPSATREGYVGGTNKRIRFVVKKDVQDLVVRERVLGRAVREVE